MDFSNRSNRFLFNVRDVLRGDKSNIKKYGSVKMLKQKHNKCVTSSIFKIKRYISLEIYFINGINHKVCFYNTLDMINGKNKSDIFG